MENNIQVRKKCICKIREIADEVFLIPIHDNSVKTENLYKINSTGVFIWSLLENNESVTQSDIIKEFVKAFSIDEATARDDVYDFLNTLFTENLIEMINCGKD
jgi:hypothetical protein